MNKKSVKLVQSNIQGEQLPTIYSIIFGHPFSTSPNYNYSIITFQNTSPQPNYSNTYKATGTSKTFVISNASVALYAEVSLIESKLEANEKLNDRICSYKSHF